MTADQAIPVAIVAAYLYAAGLGLTLLWLLWRATKDGERWYAQDTAAAVLWPVFWLAYGAVSLYCWAYRKGYDSIGGAVPTEPDDPHEFDYDDLWYEDEEDVR